MLNVSISKSFEVLVLNYFILVIPSIWVLPHVKMVRQCEISPSFSKAVFVLMCLCAQSSPNYAYPVTKPDSQGEDNTALDFGEQSSQMRSLKKCAKPVLDERILEAFPVQRDGHIEKINVAKETENVDNAKFGFQLLGMEREKEIDEIINKSSVTAKVRILWQWLNGKGKQPITFRTLINVLHEIGFSELANEMAATCKVLKIMDVHYKPELVRKYSQALSDMYDKEPVIDSEQWLPKRLHGRNLTFVDLELKEKGSNILLSDLLDDVKSGARILFIGRPGVGKSTITRHLSSTLTHGNHFYLVVRMHLSGSGKIDSLDTLLNANTDESLPSGDIMIISNYIKKTLGEEVCFLLDGYDEYVKPMDGHDYVTSLIKQKKLTKSVVIVTSRPSAVEDIEVYFDRKVEIVGFGERGIQTYLEQLELSQEENQTIHQYFDAHPNVRQLCYLPLHLSMLVYVAVDTIDTGTLSLVDTETKLYTEFLYLTIKQYESFRHEQTVESLKECFDNFYTETDLCVLLQKISKKAFEGVLSREQTFLSSSLKGLPDTINNISAKIEALSLFRMETIYDRRGFKLYKCYYSHPTFQEFLAAFYLTTLHGDQFIYIKDYWTHEMYKFFFGLIGNELSYDDETVSQMFVNFSGEDLATYQHQELYIMKCAHEIGRSSQFITYLQSVGILTNSNSMHVYADYNHDCWYVGYTLAQSPLNKLIVEKYSELALCISFIANYLKHDARSANVTELALGDYSDGNWSWFTDNEDPISIAETLEFLPAFQNVLIHLELIFFKFEYGSSVLQLGETLKSFRKLQFLALSVDISVIKEGHLERALKGLTHLEHLELGVINKHDDVTTIPDNMLEFKSITQLQSLTLYISWNKDIVDVNMTALIGGLEYLTKLKRLSIHIILYTGFRRNGATELFQGIERISSMNSLVLHLDLCWELGLGNVTTKELAAALKNRTMLKNLSLCIDFNFSGIQGPSGVIELADGLKELTELQYLSLVLRWELRANGAIDEAAIALTDGLKHLHNLHVLELNLRQNGSCSELAPLFRSLAKLQELKLKWKSPGGETDAVKLMNGLKSLKQLRKLDMSWNQIEDNDVVPLVDALKYMDYLHTLDLSHNNIGDAGVKLLAEAIENEHLTHLQVFLLNQNKFSEDGAELLAEKVVKLSQLHTLDFGPTFGACRARALARIDQQKVIGKPILSSYVSDEKWRKARKPVLPINISEEKKHMLYFVVTVVISALVGGVLCYKASQLLSSEASSNKALESKGNSEALAQGIFATLSAWKLERLRKRGLDGTGTVIVILDTAVDLCCPAFLHKSIIEVNCPPAVDVFHPAFLQRNILVVNCLQNKQSASDSTEHGSVSAAVAAGSSYKTQSTVVPSGVAPGSQLIVYRVADSERPYNEAVLKALDDLKVKVEGGIQIDVVSISYDLNKHNEEEIHWKIKELTEKGVVFVAAAGNRGCHQAYASIPACFDCVISVDALDRIG